MKWTEVAVKFSSMVDDVNVFPRSKKRLRSSSKSSKEITKKRITFSAPSNPTPIISSEVTEEPRLTSPSLAAHLITSNTPLFDSKTVAQIHNTTIASSTCARTRRKDNLDELERPFVQDFGKNCITHNQTVNSDELLGSYHKIFLSSLRDAHTLKNCCINYRKSATYSRFLDQEFAACPFFTFQPITLIANYFVKRWKSNRKVCVRRERPYTPILSPYGH